MTQRNEGATAATSAGGTGISFILFVVFLILKLTDQITWSWWWITAPLWIPTALVLALVVALALVGGSWGIFKHYTGRK